MMRNLKPTAGFLCLITLRLLSVDLLLADDAVSGKTRFYIGTYTDKMSVSKGIYRSELDLATGALTEPVLATPAVNPSFLAIHPNKQFIYAVREESNGGVAAFAIDQQTGNLKWLNEQSSGGRGPCHLIVDKSGTHVLLANYYGGSVTILPIESDGKLGVASCHIQHEPIIGKDNKKKDPLGHAVNLDAANRIALVCDAGVDKIFNYRYDSVKGTLTPNNPAAESVAADAGPRHFAWHPNQKQAYVINALELSIVVLDYNADSGALTTVQTISTVPEGIERKGFIGSEIVVHPTGKFVYASNRGLNTIAGFKVDPTNGRLTPIGQFAPGAVKIPRNFNIDPTGRFILLEGQESDDIVVFRIHAESGEFEPTGHSVKLGRPVCIKFFTP